MIYSTAQMILKYYFITSDLMQAFCERLYLPYYMHLQLLFLIFGSKRHYILNITRSPNYGHYHFVHRAFKWASSHILSFQNNACLRSVEKAQVVVKVQPVKDDKAENKLEARVLTCAQRWKKTVGSCEQAVQQCAGTNSEHIQLPLTCHTVMLKYQLIQSHFYYGYYSHNY